VLPFVARVAFACAAYTQGSETGSGQAMCGMATTACTMLESRAKIPTVKK